MRLTIRRTRNAGHGDLSARETNPTRSNPGTVAIALIATATLVAACAGGGSNLPGDNGTGSGEMVLVYSDFIDRNGDGVIDDEGTQLVVKHPGGEPQQITHDDRTQLGFEVSDKGGVVAFARGSDTDVYAIKPGASEPTKLVDSDWVGRTTHDADDRDIGGEIAVSPDGTNVAFLTSNGWGADFELQVVNTDGTGRRSLFQPSDDREFLKSPAFSPDGSQIAFIRSAMDPDPYGVYVINSDRSGLHLVTAAPDSGEESFDGLVWSHNGGKMAMLVGGASDHYSKLYIANADGSGGAHLVLDDSEHSFGTPSFSPDGTMIAYQTYGAPDEISVMNVDGGGVRKITGSGNQLTGASNPAFTPDGKSVVFSSAPRGMTSSGNDLGLFKVNLESGDVEKLSDAAPLYVRIGSAE